MIKTIANYSFLYLVAILISCSDNSEPKPDPTPQNVVPTVPNLVFPTNNLLCTTNILDFEWNASTDGNGDAISYKVDVSKDNQFATLDLTKTTSATKSSFTLEKGVAYYWRVKAIDSKNESSNYSPIFSLYTQGDGVSNHLPFVAELVHPSLNSEENSGEITLRWTASDVDSDPLTFDVYFSSVNPPVTQISENQNESTHVVTTEANKEYYWKIVVNDDKGGVTIGQVWQFNTN